MAEALEQHQIVAGKIKELEQMLLNAHPQMPLLLREIHKVLKEDPAVVTLLDEEHIRIVVNGLEKQTNTYLASSMTKSKTGASKAKLSKVTSDDLGFD